MIPTEFFHSFYIIKIGQNLGKMDFSTFLTSKLKEKKIDVSIYHSYLMGILEDNIDEEEKREMIADIIASLIVSLIQV